ncbi:MAG: histone deacetylase [Acidobacteria bacterium]|nr:histone deacetylase [Acidobacteriota bacterium]
MPADSTAPRTALVRDARYRRHDTPPGHPEQPARYTAVVEGLAEAGLLDRLLDLAPRPAVEDEIAACHARDYIRLAQQEIAAGAGHLSTGDTDVSEASYEVALLAAGGVLTAVDAVVEGRAGNAFCVLRPPGHHARPAQGMGFCVFNNIAVGARYAQQRHGLDRVLIVDWDVHHGNGTQDIFYADPSVFFASSHQSPWYPGTGDARETGEGPGRGTTLNFPFPAGSGREEILGAFRRKLLPEARAFQPDLVMISAGFDSRAGDPLGQFTLEDDDFVELTEMLRELADVTAGRRVVSVLEGGYNLAGLAAAATTHVRALLA